MKLRGALLLIGGMTLSCSAFVVALNAPVPENILFRLVACFAVGQAMLFVSGFPESPR